LLLLGESVYSSREVLRFVAAPGSMKGHVKNKLQARRLAQGFFMGSFPLLRREVPLSPSYPSFSLSALRATAVVPLGSSGYFSFRFLPLVVLTETLSLLRFAWLADWVL